MSNLPEIPTKEQMIEFFQVLRGETNRAIETVWDDVTTKRGRRALQTIIERFDLLYAEAETGVINTHELLGQAREAIAQRDEALANLDKAEDEVESRANDLAEALIEAELEHVFSDDEASTKAQVFLIARRMTLEGPAVVEEELRTDLNNILARAKRQAEQFAEDAEEDDYDDYDDDYDPEDDGEEADDPDRYEWDDDY